MFGLKHKNKRSKTTFTATILILGLILGSCKGEENTSVSAPIPSPSTSSLPVNPPSSKPSPQPEPFQEALNAGMSAANSAQFALDKADWQIVAERWQKAIQLLEAIPESNKNYELAQKKIVEYGKNADIAKTKAQQVEQENSQQITVAVAPSPTPQPSTQSQSSQPNSQPQTAPVDMAKPSNPVPSNPVPSNPVPSNPAPSNPVPSNPALSNSAHQDSIDAALAAAYMDNWTRAMESAGRTAAAILGATYGGGSGSSVNYTSDDLCWNLNYLSSTYLGRNRNNVEFYTCQGVGDFSPGRVPIIACSYDGCFLADVVRQ